jgi:hypothetical protein
MSNKTYKIIFILIIILSGLINLSCFEKKKLNVDLILKDMPYFEKTNNKMIIINSIFDKNRIILEYYSYDLSNDKLSKRKLLDIKSEHFYNIILLNDYSGYYIDVADNLTSFNYFDFIKGVTSKNHFQIKGLVDKIKNYNNNFYMLILRNNKYYIEIFDNKFNLLDTLLLQKNTTSNDINLDIYNNRIIVFDGSVIYEYDINEKKFKTKKTNDIINIDSGKRLYLTEKLTFSTMNIFNELVVTNVESGKIVNINNLLNLNQSPEFILVNREKLDILVMNYENDKYIFYYVKNLLKDLKGIK